jgi:hypothetical protein
MLMGSYEIMDWIRLYTGRGAYIIIKVLMTEFLSIQDRNWLKPKYR